MANDLTKLLQQVPNSYSDFVNTISKCAARFNLQNEMVKYIEEHPEATTSDVIEFYLYLEDSVNASKSSLP